MSIKNLKIGQRLVIGFSIIILIIVIIGVFSIKTMQSLADLTSQIYDHPLAVSNSVRDVRANINAMHRSMKDVALAESIQEVNAASKLVDNYEQQVYKDFEMIFERFLGDKTDVENAHKAFSDWKVIRDEVIKLSKQGKKNEAVDITRGKGRDHVEFMTVEIQNMIDFASAKAESFLSDSKAQERDSIYMMSVLITALIVLGINIAILISRSIIRPLNIVVGKIREISQGYLRAEVDIYSKDEVGILADSFRELQEDLQNKAEVAEKIAGGDFSTDILPRSDKDDLGKSFNNMTTSLRTATEKLRDSERRFRNLLETVPVGITVSTPEGEIIEANSAIVQMFGFDTKEEFVLIPASEYYYFPEDRKRFVEAHDKDAVIDLELTVKRKDGTPFTGIVSSITQKSKKYEEIYINSFIDITERKKMEDAIRVSEQNMQELIYIASHDLQTPIVSMVGFAGNILKKYTEEMNPAGIHAVERLKANAERMHKIILSLLDISRISTVKNPHQKIVPEKVIQDIISDIKLYIEEKEVCITVQKLPSINGDYARITTVLRNLLTNAINYGGKNILVGHKKGVYFVKDDGIGISKDNIDKIFKAGERLKKVDVDGVGMGLTFCRKVIEQHNGKIWAESAGSGKGSTFYFYLVKS